MASTNTTAGKQRYREYETIYILRPQVDPDEADRIATRISKVIETEGGMLTKVDNWGKRRLAYPIRKNTRGYFVYFKYLGYGKIVAEVERNLRMLDDVVRQQTVQTADELDRAAVTVDPADVQFQRIEVTADEEEPGLEARLGLIEAPRRADVEEPMDVGADEDVDAVGAADGVREDGAVS